jgi:predicted nucleic acid-binding Zn ribbon protein
MTTDTRDSGLLKHVSRQRTRLEESNRCPELIHGFRDSAFVKHSSGTVRRAVVDAGHLAVIKGSGYVNSEREREREREEGLDWYWRRISQQGN